MSQNQGHYKKLTLPLPAGNWGVRESRNAFPGVTSPGSRLVFEAAASRGKERAREKPGGEQKMTEVQKEHDAQIMRATQVLL